MQKNSNILSRLDWVTVMLWAVMMIMGWLNIYAAVYNENHTSIFDLSQRYGKQLLWIIAALVLAVFVIVTDNKLYFFFAWFIYGFFILCLLLCSLPGRNEPLRFYFGCSGCGIVYSDPHLRKCPGGTRNYCGVIHNTFSYFRISDHAEGDGCDGCHRRCLIPF